MQNDELLRYSRHILLPDLDVDGQEKICKARVLVVGAGGLGCPVGLYLAASGVGHIVLADPDVVDISNLQRQIGHATPDVGRAKVVSLAEKMALQNPLVRVVCAPEKLAGKALLDAVASVDVVVDCSDNFPTRQAVNAACVRLRKPLVSGAAIRYEGQVAVFRLTDASPCYACLYGDDREHEAATCSESGVFSPLVGVVGSLMAAEVMKIIVGIGEPLDGRLLLCDLNHMDWRTLRLVKDINCSVCGEG